MRIDIPDDLADRYTAMSVTQPLPLLIERQLARFADYPATVRVLPLGGDHLQQLEHLLGGGQIKSPADLVERVRRYASITLGKVVLDWTPAQKTEITHRAAKRGITPDAVAREIIDIVLEECFQSVTPYR
jgi:hypothetical protein